MCSKISCWSPQNQNQNQLKSSNSPKTQRNVVEHHVSVCGCDGSAAAQEVNTTAVFSLDVEMNLELKLKLK